MSFCKERLARYKAPKSAEFYAALLKTGSGKIAKGALREKYWKGMQKKVH
jgi:fatty-acyl-CoA synthase